VSIGDKVRATRKAAGISQEEVARRAGVSLNVINRLERGVILDPHYSTLRGIASALGVPVEDLVREPALAGKAEAPQETGQPEEERSAHDIARAAARREFEKDIKGFRRTIASEGIDPATRISDVYEPAAYDALRRQDPEELAGTLLDAARNVVHLEHENAGLRERITQLERENAQLRADAERESVRR
jgi:transcriptional regulator with XRE-family HTH domain